ncbi:Uncharacterised protein [Mycobacterium tuberculosis]|nr:Uncharacterised protein [Mycobacterium tuberculosis]
MWALVRKMLKATNAVIPKTVERISHTTTARAISHTVIDVHRTV